MKRKKTIPEHREPPKEKAPFGRCAACHQALGKAGGFEGSGLCGPCATGDAESLDEKGETW